MTHDLWASLNDKILDYLSGITLADMVETQRQNDEGLAAESAAGLIGSTVHFSPRNLQSKSCINTSDIEEKREEAAA